MIIKKQIIYFIIIFSIHNLFSNNILAQNSNNKISLIDSLWNLFQNSKHDTTKIILLNEKIAYYYENINSDSAIYYYNQALIIADKNLKKNINNKLKFQLLILKATSIRYIGMVKVQQGKNEIGIDYYFKSMKLFKDVVSQSSDSSIIILSKKGIASCNTNLGNVISDQGDYEKATEYYNNALIINQEISDKRGIVGCYTNIGNIYTDMGIFDKAINYYLKSLKKLEELGDKKGMAYCYNNIGNVHFFQNSFDRAIEYYQKSLILKQEVGDLKGVSGCYNNLGIIYNAKKEPDKAIDYYTKSLEITEKLGDIKGISACLSNLGNVNESKGNYNIAIDFFLKALKIDEEIGNKNGKIVCYNNLSAINNTLANLSKNEYEKNKYLKNAIEYGTKAFLISKEIDAVPRQKETSYSLMNAFKMMKDYKKALEYAEIFIVANDSMFKSEKTSSIANAEKKFESEKKQLQIEKLNKENELKESELLRQQEAGLRQKNIIYFVISLLILIAVFAFFVVQRLRITRKQKNIISKQKAIVDEKNNILNQQNEEIHAQRDEIESQRDEIIAQRDLVMNQKDHIEEQNLKITDSINYAKNIQQAILPSSEYAKNILKEHFILFKPKDIVSGDFYWATIVNEMLIVTVADCTGHGVPGAFMSMLGVSFLNEIVRKKEVTKASEVLDHLRLSIIDALQQKGNNDEQKDGMDISIIAIEKQITSYELQVTEEESKDINPSTHKHISTFKAQWAGANNPLYLIRKLENCKLNDSDEKTPIIEIFKSLNLGIESFSNLSILESSNSILIEFKGDKMPVSICEEITPFTNHEFNLLADDCIYLVSDGFQDQFGGEKGKKFMSKQLKQLFIDNCFLPMETQNEIYNQSFENWKGNFEQIDDITLLGIKI